MHKEERVVMIPKIYYIINRLKHLHINIQLFYTYEPTYIDTHGFSHVSTHDLLGQSAN